MAQAFVHPTAVVDDGVTLGDDTKVWHFVHVSRGARIGARCALGQNVFVGVNVQVGDGVRVQNNVSLYEGVEIADDVFLGPSCVFTNVENPRAFVQRKQEYQRTRVEKGASVGANATIVCGVTLGAYSFIGAGAVVTHDVPAYALMAGVPARRIGFMCKCGERLKVDASQTQCQACGTRYVIRGETCTET